MSETPNPCPCGGTIYVGEYRFTGETKWGVGCIRCNRGPSIRHSKDEAVRAWNASPTPPTTEGREKAMEDAQRIVAWDDDGRLADDEWLVERNETAIIAICRALLSSPRVEEVRREALEEAARVVQQLADELARLEGASNRRVQIGSHLETCATILLAIRFLSLLDGEGKEKLARSPSALSAPTTTDTKDTTND